MLKVALAAFQGEIMYHVLLNAQDIKERGSEAKLLQDEAKLLQDLNRPENAFHSL